MLVAGCGGGETEVETDPTATGGETEPAVETVPEPIEPEEPMEGAGMGDRDVPDYSTMEPVEYGVEDVFFAFDEYDLDESAMATLARNARILKEHDDVVILVEGHCDERGTVQYNLALGEKRAKAVRDYLISLGVPSNRLRFTSYGESRPFAMGSNERAWAQNRRAHFARP
ncbi:peptidoglycan-associated lipoprotein Pal [bacterium]|nr:peptidoglycan-associated lipoprotein Pal [bacterium]